MINHNTSLFIQYDWKVNRKLTLNLELRYDDETISTDNNNISPRLGFAYDPSHSVGLRSRGADGILDVMQVTAQGVIAAANMILVDFHPAPEKALVDGQQALLLNECRILSKTCKSPAKHTKSERL